MKRPASTSFRLGAETDRQIDELARVLGVRRVQVVRLAVRKLYRGEGLERKRGAR